MERKPTEIAPVHVEESQQLGPFGTAVMATATCALIAVLVAFLLDVPLDTAWRWLVAGALVALVIIAARCLAPSVVGLVEVVTNRDIYPDGKIGRPDTIRLLPVRAQAPRIKLSGDDGSGYEADDLRALVHHTYAVDYSARSFYGMTLPSGRKITGYDDLKPFLNILIVEGLLTDRSERSKGQLHADEREALRLLGL